MKKIIQCVIVSCQIFTIGINTVKAADKPTPAELLEIKKLIEALEMDMKPSKDKVPSRYDSRPAPMDVTEEQIDSYLDVLSNSFFLQFRRKDSIRIEGDIFLLPNIEMAKLDVTWTKVVTKTGESIFRQPTETEKAEDAKYGQEPKMSRDGSYTAKLRLTTDNTKIEPYAAEGKAILTVPIHFIKFEFVSTDVGKSYKSSEMIVELKHCENDFFHLCIDGLKEEVELIIIARDATRIRLAHNKTIRKPKGGFDYLDHGDKKSIDMEYMVLVKGEVSVIEVYVPSQTLLRELTVSATSEPKISEGEPIRAPRYLRYVTEPSFQKITAKQIREQTKVIASRNYAMIGYNTPEIQVCLPKIDNSAFATIKFIEPRLLDENGNEVKFELERGLYTHESFSDEIRFAPKGKDKIVKFKRAVGTVQIRYPTAISTLILTRESEEQAGIKVKFEGPIVEYSTSRKDIGPGLVTNEWGIPDQGVPPLQAYDSHGRRLRRLDYISGGFNPENNISQYRLAFWGEVAKLRIEVVNDWAEIEICYDLSPAPMLPKGRESIF